jgi:replication factor C subunit 2/4
MLLFGPPGTGKTSLIHAVCYELFGTKVINERVIELNASEDNGIGTVRNKIIKFAKMTISAKDENYPCPDFKIVILDEADTMTEEAQTALRKVIESMSKITIFCFICNYVNKIIEPIASRCIKLKFKLLNKNALFDKLKYIAQQENLNINDNILTTIIDISEGDARRSIMNLQNMKYLLNNKKNITSQEIIQMNGGIPDNYNILKQITNKNVLQIQKITISLFKEGYVIKSILKKLIEEILNSKYDEIIKANILIELCNTDKKLSEGCTEYIQLLNILIFVSFSFKEKN